jgi:hypothetical protein
LQRSQGSVCQIKRFIEDRREADVGEDHEEHEQHRLEGFGGNEGSRTVDKEVYAMGGTGLPSN